MLQVSPEKVCFVIAKARAFDVQEAADEEDSGSNASDDDFRSVLVESADDPTYSEVKAFIDALNEDEQAELVALAWLGREDYAVSEWEQAVADATDRHTGVSSDYLLGMPLLADYLEAGLSQFEMSCEGFEG